MVKREIRNAKITGTFLGIEDHGIFTAILYLVYAGSGQGFGTHDLKYEKYGIEYLKRILNVVGVYEWEKLKGKYIRADAGHSKVYGIGHVIEDKWFYPEEDLNDKKD